MTELATFEVDRAEIGRYLGLNPRDPKSHAVVAVCERYGLDPILKHVVVIPSGGVYITRDGLLHVAHRSGQLDGIEVLEQGETKDEWWAKVAIYRKDMSRPFTFRGRYSKGGSNKKFGPEMALKCAEALALRRAFDVAGLPVLEERDAAAPTVEGPRVVSTERLMPKPTAVVEDGEGTLVDTVTGEIINVMEADVSRAEPEVVEAEIVEDTEPPAEPLITPAQSKKLFATLRDLGIAERAPGLEMIGSILGHPIDSTKALTRAEASMVIDTLTQMVAQQDQPPVDDPGF